jgi:hypothetical protein
MNIFKQNKLFLYPEEENNRLQTVGTHLPNYMVHISEYINFGSYRFDNFKSDISSSLHTQYLQVGE